MAVACSTDRCETLVKVYSDLSLNPEDERYFSEDFELTEPGPGTSIRGMDQFREYVNSWNGAFPDLSSEVIQVVDGGDWMAIEYAMRGTHQGPLPGPEGEIPATGRRVELMNLDLIHFDDDGKIDLCRTYYDSGSVLSQLGLSS